MIDDTGRANVLILGGYGTFGGRLARLLADEPRLRLIVAGRSESKARQFCDQLVSKAELMPAHFDRNGDVKTQLAGYSPDLIVDASGPFQGYGENPYRLVRAALACGTHYLDLADGAEFVAGIGEFDERAADAGLFILSGVSSFPVLTCAIVRELARDMSSVDAISGGIAPSPYAGVGSNVMRAIAGYAGKPIALIREGRSVVTHALTESRRYTVSVPGRLPLQPLRFSLVDVPDLRILPQCWPEVQSIWIGAGPVPEILHRTLNLLAHLVRLRVIPSIEFLTPVMGWVSEHVRWGEHRGGMYVVVTGKDANALPIEKSWHMLAEADDGPMIPSMAAESIIRAWLDGKPPASGARPATMELSLADYDRVFGRRAIYHGQRVHNELARKAPLYRRVLGDAYDILPRQIRELHELTEDMRYSGVASVERGRGLLSRLVARLMNFPGAAHEIPVSVKFSLRDGREVWRRSFGTAEFSSTQEQGHGYFDGLLVERFGSMAFGIALVIVTSELHLILRRWTLFGVSMPMFLAPTSTAFERVDDGRFCFHVRIGIPMSGLIVEYNGWLTLDD